ncbi:MAG: hypothetical protein ACKVU1_01200 [bacterium]
MFYLTRTFGAIRSTAATLCAICLGTAILVASQNSSALAIGTAFTYQGQLKKSSAPYTGTADLTFRLFTAASGGVLLGTQNRTGLAVSDGLFTTQLDFGSVFDGAPRWLEIAATTPGDGGPTTLTPRQELSAVPYAVRAENGGTGGSQWTTSGSSIFYNGGSVGIGTSTPGSRLSVSTGTESINPAFFQNNSTDFACFATQNVAANGFGWYDAWSARHYIGGSIGMGTFTPEAKIHVEAGDKFAIKARAIGGGAGPTSTAIWGIGDGSAFSGPAVGVYGQSDYGDGVQGVTSSSLWYGGYFDNTGGGTALFCDGLADVRSLRILGGADIVEGFDARGDDDTNEKPEPGTVLVIDDERAGELRTSNAAYDAKVAGVVSGANGISHGMKLGQDGALDGETLVAMTGRVYVKCSSENGAIRPGDLLTTSATSGHAMRATDRALANGAVIGKAMSSLDARTGLVLVLVNLQ